MTRRSRSAARYAAVRQMLRMLPPESRKRRAMKARSTSAATGHALGQVHPPERRRSSSSGIGKSTTASSRRSERLVDVGAQVRRQDGQAVERLHPLQQVGDLDVGVAVARVAHLGALAEERVGLVEEQHAVDAVGLGEDPVEVLLGLADVLVDDRGEVDDVEVEAELAGDDLGATSSCPCPESPANSAVIAGAARGAAGRMSPLVEHDARGGAPARPARAAATPTSRRQDEVGPADARLDAAGEALQAGGVLRPRAGRQVVDGRPVRGRHEATCAAASAARADLLGRRVGTGRRRRVGSKSSASSPSAAPRAGRGRRARDAGALGTSARLVARPCRVPGRLPNRTSRPGIVGERADGRTSARRGQRRRSARRRAPRRAGRPRGRPPRRSASASSSPDELRAGRRAAGGDAVRAARGRRRRAAAAAPTRSRT